ncbi:MAG: hypothetical protein K2X98_01060 [Alphaproteobacteria bacterium]|nr:hypothetical protein [Alphaproteobacteria bacterium]
MLSSHRLRQYVLVFMGLFLSLSFSNASMLEEEEWYFQEKTRKPKRHPQSPLHNNTAQTSLPTTPSIKTILPDNPRFETHALPSSWVRTLEGTAKGGDNEDLCTLLLRYWEGPRNKFMFMKQQWKDRKDHLHVKKNLWGTFADFLLTKRYAVKEPAHNRAWRRLENMYTKLPVENQMPVIRYHLAINTIDLYMASTRKKRWNPAKVYGARQVLRDLGQTYPIAAFYYCMFSLDKSLEPFWDNDPFVEYNQERYVRLFEQVCTLGFTSSYNKSIVNDTLNITDEDRKSLLQHINTGTLLSPSEKHRAYTNFTHTHFV